MAGRPVWRVACGVLVLALACGPEPEAPVTQSNTGDDVGGCGRLEDARRVMKGAATRADVAPLGDLVRTRLVATGAWRQAVRVGLQVFRANPPTGLGDALDELRREEGLGGLMPHVRAVLHYWVGSPKQHWLPEEQFALGEHLAPVRVVSGTLKVCRPQVTMGLLSRLASVQVPCASCASGTRLWMAAFMEALARVVDDPELGGILDRIEFTDGASSRTAIGREAFGLLLDLVASGIASPSFSLSYFDAYLRVQVDDVLGTRLSSASRANLSAFMDVLRSGLLPELGMLAPLQETLGCMLRQDPDHAVAGMLFDYVRLQSLEYRAFARNLPHVFESAHGERLIGYAARVSRQLALDETLARDAVAVVLQFLVEGVDREFLREMDRLQGTGIGSGLLQFGAQVLRGCSQQ